MNPSQVIKNPVRAVHLFVESRRTQLLEPMGVAELRAICKVLEFDRWCDDERLEGKLVERNAWVNLQFDVEQKTWWIYHLVIFDGAKEALIDIDGGGDSAAIITQRGQPKHYKKLPAVYNDMNRILTSGAGPKDKCYITITTACV